MKVYLLPLVFGLLLVAYFTDTFFHLLPHRPSVENRRPAAFPRVKWDYLDPFPRDYEAYYNDAFRWRGHFQAFNARLQSVTKGRSPLPDLVAIGKDDWFFKGGLQMDIYRGKRRFTPTELREVTQELLARRDSVEARGGRYYFAVAPLKHQIYPQFLPDHVRQLNPEYATRQLYRALDRVGIDYVDLHAALRTYTDTASQTDLYYRTDHHWTVKAGVVATNSIVERLTEDSILPAAPPGLGYGTLSATTRQSDHSQRKGFYYSSRLGGGMTLAKMAGRAKMEQESFYSLHRHGGWQAEEIKRPDIPTPPKFPYPTEYAKQRINEDRSLPTLFVNRESFGENLFLPLSEYFSSSFWLFDEWEHGLNLDHYDREGGDVYLQLVWEGFLFNLLEVPEEDGKW